MKKHTWNRLFGYLKAYRLLPLWPEWPAASARQKPLGTGSLHCWMQRKNCRTQNTVSFRKAAWAALLFKMFSSDIHQAAC